MGFSDENRILMKNVYVFIVKQTNSLWNFQIKDEDWTNFWKKPARNWHDCYRWGESIQNLSCFSICIHKLDII